jgi:hypothetical protein
MKLVVLAHCSLYTNEATAHNKHFEESFPLKWQLLRALGVFLGYQDVIEHYS